MGKLIGDGERRVEDRMAKQARNGGAGNEFGTRLRPTVAGLGGNMAAPDGKHVAHRFPLPNSGGFKANRA